MLDLDKLQKLCDRVKEAEWASVKSSDRDIWAYIHREPELARNERNRQAGAALPELIARIRELEKQAGNG